MLTQMLLRPERAEEWLRAVFEHSALGIALVDMQGRLVESNPALGRMIGYSVEELRALTLDRITHPDDLPGDRELLRQLLRGWRAEYQVENRYLRKDGAIVWGRLAVSVLRDHEGLASHALAMVEDITDRKRAEAALEASEAKFRALIEGAADLVSVLAADGTILYESPSIERILGYRPEELVGTAVLKLVHPEDREHTLASFQRILGSPGEELAYAMRYRHRDGSYRWLEGRGRNLLDDPAVRGVVANSRDITERKIAEDELARERALFEQLFESSPEGVVLVDPDDRVLRINPEFTRIFGYAEGQAVGRTIRDLLLPEGTEDESSSVTARVARGERVELETTRRHSDGSPIDVAIRGVPIQLGGDQIAIYGIYQDIAERKAGERALRASEERFRTMVDVLGEGIMITDLEERVLYTNRRNTEITGYSAQEMVGQVASELLLPPEERERMAERQQQRADGKSGRYEMRQFRKDGSLVWVEVSGSPLHDEAGRVIGTVGAITDITERKELEQALRRMSTTDVLTGLLNRRGFVELAGREWTLATRRGTDLLLLYLDLDAFKPINDRYGHAEGDRLLQQVAGILQRCFRFTDVIARLGGDEFVVLAPDAEAEASLIGRVQGAFDKFNRDSGLPYELRASIGTHRAVAGVSGSLDDLLAEADRHMYERKRSKGLGPGA